MSKKYYVVYTYEEKNGGTGLSAVFGCMFAHELPTEQDIRELQTLIEERNGLKKVLVLNWKEMQVPEEES